MLARDGPALAPRAVVILAGTNDLAGNAGPVTPEQLPYLNGETYSHVPGQFVPRFFWPGNPGRFVWAELKL